MIKVQDHPILPNVKTVYEERYLSCEVDGWKTHIIHQQYRTWTDGVFLNDAAHTTLNLSMRRETVNEKTGKVEKESYEGGITIEISATPISNARYIGNYFYKTGGERRRSVEFDKVKPFVDAIIDYYLSPEGQQAMLIQTINKSEEELQELTRKTIEVSAYLTSMRAELETSNMVNKIMADEKRQ